MKKGDILLAAAVLAIAAGVYLYYSTDVQPGGGVEVMVEGESVAFLPLDRDDNIRVETEQGYNVISVQDGVVAVTEADCRDQICVEHKKIRNTGETIVCLPHKLVVEVIGDSPAEFDTVVM